MASATTVDLTLLPGARELLALHARELPQRDDLCGAFCASLALRTGLAGDNVGEELDQDAVALAAGSVVSAVSDPSILPFGEPGRRDYRLELPRVEDPALSGTTVQGLVDAVDRLAGGDRVAIPLAGPWSAAALSGLFDLVAELEHPAALLANLATRHLWGTHPRHDQLLRYLLDGNLDGPPTDWDVGHYACIVARVRGPGGSAYVLADTYPALGVLGLHAQPQERLLAAIERRGGPAAGGILAIVDAADGARVSEGARGLGCSEGAWDNGTISLQASDAARIVPAATAAVAGTAKSGSMTATASTAMRPSPPVSATTATASGPDATSGGPTPTKT